MADPAAQPRAEISFLRMARAPHQAIAMVFGLGLSPVWPGTLGTLAGFPLFLSLQPMPPIARAVAYAALVALGCWASQRTGDDLGKQDHRSIVVDETLGMALVLECIAPGWIAWGLAFALFRLFDVVKPWPANLVHRHGHGGIHVVLDDLIAAAYAGLAAYLVLHFADF